MYGDLEETKETILHWRSEPRMLRFVSGAATFTLFLWLTPFVLSFGGDGGMSTFSWWSFPVMVTGLLGLFTGLVLFINGMYYKPKDEPTLNSFDPDSLQTCTMRYRGEIVYLSRDVEGKVDE